MSAANPVPQTTAAEFDRRNLDWYVDKLVQVVVFIAGISAIIFVIGIFTFITMEGFGFLLEDFSFSEFFFSEFWDPSDEDAPEYGILALAAGTAAVTGLAMIVAIPFSLGAAIYIGEFATGKPREYLKMNYKLLMRDCALKRVLSLIGLSRQLKSTI